MPTKKFKASILVVTMMIMGIILVSALSISLVSIQERKASMGASKSNQAYQIADTGIELVMADIVKGNNDKTNELTGCQASDGLIHGTGYTVELKDADENKIACNSNTDLSEVVHIKSIGTASGQAQRSIEAAVAAAGGCEWVTIDSGGTQVGSVDAGETSHVRYTDGADHSAMQMCSDAGYDYFSGACRFTNSGIKFQGSVVSNQHTYNPDWGISCHWGGNSYYFNATDSSSQILCCK